MKPITMYGYEYDKYSWSELGDLLKEIDESAPYEQDASLLFKNGSKYTLLESSGCSCWDGNWEGWTNLTKSELKKLGESWSKDAWGSSKSMGEYIKESVK